MHYEPVLWDSDLEDFLERATPQPPGNNGKIHLLIGDSIARDSPIGVSAPDVLLRLVKGGHSWRRLAAEVEDSISSWKCAAEGHGHPLGSAVVWMSGNDLYPKRGNLIAGMDLDALAKDALRAVVALNTVAEEVIVLGPLSRFKFDQENTWTQTPAYLAERCLRHCLSDAANTRVENIGRSLTAMRGKCKALIPAVREYFAKDCVHLSNHGYARVMNKVPGWLNRAPGDEEEDQ